MQNNITQLLHTQDTNTIAQLYDAYGAALYGIVLRIVSNEDTAKHVLQDSFVKAWKNGSKYDETKGTIFTWLLNIARNTAIDAIRTPHYRNSINTVGIEVLEQVSSDVIIDTDTMGLKEMVLNMNVKHAFLIEMIYFKGYTQKELSEETGIPLGTIKTRLRSAISDLRQCLM
jgi:RNA polymerase sigma-70 factor, ECF subfamily